MTAPIIRISAYKAWKGKPGCKPYDTDFYTEMERIKSGYYKEVAEQYRSLPDGDIKRNFKIDNLPSLTISAVCKNWRRSENVLNHTGLLNLDIDKKSNQHITDWALLRDQIFGLRGVVASFLSVSGEGVTFIVKINPDKHKDAFFSIVDGMKQIMGINIDPGLHDVVRLRFVSDDPGLKLRENFDEIPISEPSKQYLENKKFFSAQSSILEPIGDADSEYNFTEAVKRASIYYQFAQGQKWSFLVSVAGACNVMGMTLDYCKSQVEKTFLKQSGITKDRLLKPITDVYKLYKHQHATFSNEIKFERLNNKISSHLITEWLHKGQKPTNEEIVSIAQQFDANIDRVEMLVDRVFGEYADEFNYNKFPKVQQVQIWLNRNYDFKFNVVTSQPEFSHLGNINYETVNPDEVYRQLSLNKLKYSLSDVKSLLKSAFVKPCDPILEYFQSLTWDGKDHIQLLADYIKTDDDELFWPKQFKKSLIRSIVCGLGKKENRIVMVLYGKKQETGKTTFIRFLSPWGTEKYFTESPIIGGNTKDTEIRFSENFIYNIEELAGLNRVDINKLKADISKSSIKERRAYGTFETSAPRRCNFWASTNQKEFLHDEENTRWMVFRVQEINWNYKQEIDIHKVWGQAWNLYNNGFDYELDREDRAIREHLNEEYRYRRSEEELLPRYFEIVEPGKGEFMSATEIAIYLNAKSPSLKINPNNIGKTIADIYGISSCQAKINGKNVRGYWVRAALLKADGEHRNTTNGIGFVPYSEKD